MHNIFVLFDMSCDLCVNCKAWLQMQQQKVVITFIEAGSNEARRLFPGVNHDQSLNELTVIADNGAVYHGTKAWLMVLWCLRDYRSWSHTLAAPDRMPMAKRFITMISDNRKVISKVIPAPKRPFYGSMP